MCGIAGEIRFDGIPSNPAITKAMCDAEFHRGPDDEGYYSHGPVSLGIRRLAIIDLTKGLYPLQNETGTIRLVFNGEVYGFDALRLALEDRGHRFRSKTDAETVVHGYEEWGIGCLDKLDGMFAFALWDDREQLLWIARDHFGIKPLYYHGNKSFITFASEIKPILARPDIRRRPNERVIRDYIRSARVDDTPETFFDGIRRLPPGHQLLIRPSGTLRLEKYWTPKISRELNGDLSGNEAETTRRLFLESVERQLVSDVPVGTCLSGGIDSSSVVSAIRRVHPKGSTSTGEWIKAFSAVFPGYAIDETKYAKIVCESAQAEYNPVEPKADELWRDLLDLVKCQEEPFSSTSIYAQYRVMKRAKERGITVLLDGQGSDELLCGYIPLYLHYLLMLRKHGMHHRLLVEGVRSLDLIGPLIKLRMFGYFMRLLAYGKSLMFGAKPRKATNRSKTATAKVSEDDLPGVLEMLTSVHGLPALLRYEDKNSMWHSIEARVPFLDRPFFEYVAALPLDRKLRDGWTKYIFRRAMSGILPEQIRLRRSKIGFETPEKRWLENELRGVLQEFFSKPDLQALKHYSLGSVRKLLSKPRLSVDDTSRIWRVLNLELWYREFFGGMKAAE
jgi:asparagine synthase (glutamine-hydrolysing)